MKLRNKKTGEIVRVVFLNNWQTDDGTEIGFRECNTNIVYSYDSLAELNAEWEDVPEEPKEYWYIYGNQILKNECDGVLEDGFKEIGNYFETKEEAERAVEKLKAWKRLKDKGFRITLRGCKGNAWLQANWGNLQGDYSDVLFLFGGEE